MRRNKYFTPQADLDPRATMLPSYTNTTVWEAGCTLIHWTNGSVTQETATCKGRATNTPEHITFAYYSEEAALWKWQELKGLIETPLAPSGDRQRTKRKTA